MSSSSQSLLDSARICASEALQSSSMKRRAALKKLERSIIPKLDAHTAFSILSNDDGINQEGECQAVARSLACVLLNILEDDDTPEICREKSAIILRECLQRAFVTNDRTPQQPPPTPSKDFYSHCLFLVRLYLDFCILFHSRFSFRSNGGATAKGGMLVGRRGPPVETSEEIRILIASIASDILSFLQERCCFGPTTALPRTEGVAANVERSETSHNNDCGEVHLSSNIPYDEKEVITSTSLLCQSLAKGGLTDPYPDLRRKCCTIIIQLSTMFPAVVRMHAEMILRPIVGGDTTDQVAGAESSSVGGGGNEMVAFSSSSPSGASCLLLHRHAKTRQLAVEASSAILSSFPSSNNTASCANQNNEQKNTDEGKNTVLMESRYEGSKGGTMEDILETHVLLGWEKISSFDRSASVRTALMIAVGKTAHCVEWDKFDDASSSEEVSSITQTVGEKEQLSKFQASPSLRLLILLLGGVVDETESVRDTSFNELSKMAKYWIAGYAIDTATVGASEIRNDVKSDGTCQKEESSVVIAADMVKFYAPDIVTSLLNEMAGNWATLQRKMKAIQSLEVTIRLMNRSSQPNNNRSNCLSSVLMTSIILTLCDCARHDEENRVSHGVSSCARALGEENNMATSAINILLPGLSGETCTTKNKINLAHDQGNDDCTGAVYSSLLLSSPEHLSYAMVLLESVIRGSSELSNCNGLFVAEESQSVPRKPKEWLDSTMVFRISAVLGSKFILDMVASSELLSWSLVDTCRALVTFSESICFVGANVDTTNTQKLESAKHRYSDSKKCKQKCKTVVNMLSCIVQLLVCKESYGIKTVTEEILERLAGKIPSVTNKHEMLELYFEDLMGQIVCKAPSHNDASVWDLDDPSLSAFDALLRYSGGKAVGEHFDIVTPTFEKHLSSYFGKNGDDGTDSGMDPTTYSVRISIMALLETVVSDKSLPRHLLHPFTAKLIESSIIPNMQWRAGGMASALRKLSAATLFSLLRFDGATADCLFQTAPRLVPVLTSNLEDDDGSTRELVCSSLAIIFDLLHGVLGEEAVTRLYPSLVKCLDDSCDIVRYAACRALKSFLKSVPASHFCGTPVDYIVDQLLVHLDDPDTRFQDTILDVITVALDIDLDLVVKKCTAARSSHRSTHFCDMLLQRADEKAALKKAIGF